MFGKEADFYSLDSFNNFLRIGTSIRIRQPICRILKVLLILMIEYVDILEECTFDLDGALDRHASYDLD